MAGLTSATIAASYDQLLIVDRDGGGNTTTHVAVKDGDGDTTFPITLATDAIMITSTNRLEFGDDASYIHQSADGVLDLVSDTEIELTATAIDINGTVDISGNTTLNGGTVTLAVDTDFVTSGGVNGMSIDGTTFSVDGTNNRVGIGTAAPTNLLTIQAGTSADGDQVVLRLNNDETALADGDGVSMIFGLGTDYRDAGKIGVFSSDSTHDQYNMRFSVRNTSNTLTEYMRIVGADGTTDHKGNYIANEQGRQDHVANTMSAPYYRFDGVDDGILNTPGTFPTSGYPLSLMVSFRTESTAGTSLFGLYPSGSGSYQIAIAVNEGSAGNITIRARNESNLLEHSSTAVYNDGKWHTAVAVFVSSTLRYLYIDGVLDSTHTGTGSYYGSLNRIGVGYEADSSGGGHYLGEVSKCQVWNLALSASEVKELYSGTSVPFKYKGADGTELVTNGTFASDTGWTKETGFTISGGKLVVDAGNSYTAYQSAAKTLVAGKRYFVKFTVSNYSSGGVKIRLGSDWQLGTSRTANGTYTEIITAPNATGNVIGISAQGTTDLSVDDFTAHEAGCVAEYDGSGITNDKWYDKSGNGLDGIVSGATDENTAGAPWISANHPAFLATPASTQDIASGSDVAVAFGTEIFDQDSNFASNTFTAPVTGKYQFNMNLRVEHVDTAAGYLHLQLITSNRNYNHCAIDPNYSADLSYYWISISVLADMDKGDTANALFIASSGHGDTDITADSNFSGYLVC
tara:strand:+ start:270 stop:2498 length:2229 start_codon:yes stop_codon:yes gene_type:complete